MNHMDANGRLEDKKGRDVGTARTELFSVQGETIRVFGAEISIHAANERSVLREAMLSSKRRRSSSSWDALAVSNAAVYSGGSGLSGSAVPVFMFSGSAGSG